MWVKFNPNPLKKNVGDCAIRAIAKATNQTWEQAYIALIVQGYEMCDMPSSNAVWGEYLKTKGFEKKLLPTDCDYCYSLNDFCNENNKGMYVIALPSHVVTAIDGFFYDAWNSGQEVPIYYYKKKEE